ncbi:hypothetical protein TREMEDRAFT_73567 [Tremella mesenterica DSM 1558]|uniref:uncharacterized protein n=1 Tax=Tremella mesenterica (strain ATCC 24925 / CBS 8224 / DSM 1558 / NBRC 9311 / NRRL Y-6157 / RJB 2259-6 / UBC 559-6) TaxID=578456 RepID=UPI0003F48FC9|nr:uncharacterized protein TREMEDRAFT_73567 [Tremella mesenterica DSM 1558]EIW70793.1 hypothetical protein TREMEDRAFT_73567 [Tremella mesenterica DSM 1558]
MTSLLPPNLLKLFAPRPPPPFLKPLSRDESKRGPDRLAGVGSLVQRIREQAEDEEVKKGMQPVEEGAAEDVEMNGGEDEQIKEDSSKVDGKGKGKVRKEIKRKKDKISEMGVVGQEAIKMRRELRAKRKEQYKKDSEANYRPQDDTKAVGDPYKTLFISRLSSKATEQDLRREFEMYGAIEHIRIVRNRKGKSNSYAFIVYERERDMKAAYKDAEGIPIHHKKILVDVERGRTVKGWKPRRLGGGLGGRPKPPTAEQLAQLQPPTVVGPSGPGGPGGPGGMETSKRSSGKLDEKKGLVCTHFVAYEKQHEYSQTSPFLKDGFEEEDLLCVHLRSA